MRKKTSVWKWWFKINFIFSTGFKTKLHFYWIYGLQLVHFHFLIYKYYECLIKLSDTALPVDLPKTRDDNLFQYKYMEIITFSRFWVKTWVEKCSFFQALFNLNRIRIKVKYWPFSDLNAYYYGKKYYFS